MKVLFLDIDGVLNSHEFHVAMQRMLAEVRAQRTDPTPIRHRLCEPAVQRLNEVVRRTGCKVVLSSTWRMPACHGLADTQRILVKYGFLYGLLDSTPILGRPRGQEILQWVTEHQPDVYAVVDDSDDMDGVRHRLVRTDLMVGLQDQHVEALVELLGESSIF